MDSGNTLYNQTALCQMRESNLFVKHINIYKQQDDAQEIIRKWKR